MILFYIWSLYRLLFFHSETNHYGIYFTRAIFSNFRNIDGYKHIFVQAWCIVCIWNLFRICNMYYRYFMFYLHISIRLCFWYIICIFVDLYIYIYCTIVCVYDYFRKICGTYVLFVLNSHTHASILPRLMFCHSFTYIYIYISINCSQNTFFQISGALVGPQDYESAGQIMFQVAQVWVVGSFWVNRLGVENAKNLIWEMRKFIQFVWKFGAM